MFREPQSGYFALALTIVLGLLCVGYVSVGFAFSKGYQRAGQEHSAYYAERDQAEIQYGECLDVAVSLDGARECIDDAERQSRESERAEQDLNAQREMAQWAEGMLWAAWVLGTLSFGATILGVRYVYLTLLATQTMAKDAARIGAQQVNSAEQALLEAKTQTELAQQSLALQYKPWLNVTLSGDFVHNLKDFDGKAADIRPAQVRMTAHIAIENLSQWPARITMVRLGLDGFDELPEFSGIFTLRAGTKVHFLDSGEFTFTGKPDWPVHLGVTPTALTSHEFWVFKSNLPIISVAIEYQSTLGDVYETSFAFKPSGAFGSVYNMVGGGKANYDRKKG